MATENPTTVEDPFDSLKLELERVMSMVNVLRKMLANDNEAGAEMPEHTLDAFLFTVDHHLEQADKAADRLRIQGESPASRKAS